MNELATHPTDQGPGHRFFIIDEDHLRQLILDLSPDIRRDTERMGDLIRDIVRFEREKLGLDNPRGTLQLWENNQKGDPHAPVLVGVGRVAGRSYRAAAWISKDHKIKIALLPQKRK